MRTQKHKKHGFLHHARPAPSRAAPPPPAQPRHPAPCTSLPSSASDIAWSPPRTTTGRPAELPASRPGLPSALGPHVGSPLWVRGTRELLQAGAFRSRLFSRFCPCPPAGRTSTPPQQRPRGFWGRCQHPPQAEDRSSGRLWPGRNAPVTDKRSPPAAGTEHANQPTPSGSHVVFLRGGNYTGTRQK